MRGTHTPFIAATLFALVLHCLGVNGDAGRGRGLAPVSTAQWRATLACWANGSWVADPERRRRDAFVWQPAGRCPYSPWDRAKYCALMRGRRVLVVGDSLNEQLHDALADAAAPPEGSPCSSRGVGSSCRGHTLCDGDDTHFLRFVRNDRLSLGAKKAQISDKWVNMPFSGALRRDDPDLIILNRGAHYSPDATLVREVVYLIRYLRRNHRRALIVLRTTPPGAVACERAREPLAALPAPSAGDPPLPFKWGSFARQNDKLAAAVARFHPHVVMMDVYLATALRPDARRGRNRRGRADCLHLREPSSALDEWVRRLYNIVSLRDRSQLY